MPKISVVTVPQEAIKVDTPDIEYKVKRKNRILHRVLPGIMGLVKLLINKELVVFNIIAFFMGRLVINGDMAPFGMAMFAALFRFIGGKAIICGMWAIIGLLSNMYWMKAGTYLLVIAGYIFLSDKLVSRYNRYMMPAAISCLLLAGNLGINIFHSFSLYSVISAAIEAAMCLILSYLFIYGIPLLRDTSAGSEKTNDVVACAILILAIAIAGIGSLTIYTLSIRNIVGGVFIMSSAMMAGVGISTAVGVAMGVVIGLSDGNAAVSVGVFAVAGLIAGIFRDMGRFAVNIGYFMGCLLTVLYIGSGMVLTSIFAEAGIAALLTMLIPTKRLYSFGGIAGMQTAYPVYMQNITNRVNARLESIAGVFSELAIKINQDLTTRVNRQEKDVATLVLNSVGKVCETCSKRDVCWDKNFYKMYQTVIDLYGTIQHNKNNEPGFSTLLSNLCVQPQALLEAVKSAAMISQLGSYWHKKAIDSEQAMGEQLKALSNILKNLIYDIKEQPPSDQQTADCIKTNAAVLECPVKQVAVTGAYGNKTINIVKAPCQGTKECRNTILPLVSNLVKDKLFLKAECGNEKRDCSLTLTAARRYRIEIGMANLSKDKEANGDSHAIIPVCGGKIALMISDGMGSGSKAQGESAAAVHFMESLLTAGFDINLAVKTVNSLLLVSKREERFATMDMAVIDTYSGEVEFLKIGAAPSFIKRVGEVFTVTTPSLPIGIMEQIEINPFKQNVSAGDIIVLVSDGIADCESRADKEVWLVNYLRRVSSTNPQHLADAIINQAVLLAGNSRRKDDMTVLVARVTE